MPSGFVPAEFQGTSLNTFEMVPDKMIRFLRNSELHTDAQRAQLDLAQALNRRHHDSFGQDAFLEGGKNGPSLIPGNGAMSELVRRISLPKTDDDFMPTEGEPLPKEQIARSVSLVACAPSANGLIAAWVCHG